MCKNYQKNYARLASLFFFRNLSFLTSESFVLKVDFIKILKCFIFRPSILKRPAPPPPVHPVTYSSVDGALYIAQPQPVGSVYMTHPHPHPHHHHHPQHSPSLSHTLPMRPSSSSGRRSRPNSISVPDDRELRLYKKPGDLDDVLL